MNRKEASKYIQKNFGKAIRALGDEPMKDKQPEWENKICSQTDDLFNAHLLNENRIARKMFLNMLAYYRKALLEGLLMEERKEAIYEHQGLVIDNENMQAGSLLGYNQAVQEQNKKIKKLTNEVL